MNEHSRILERERLDIDEDHGPRDALMHRDPIVQTAAFLLSGIHPAWTEEPMMLRTFMGDAEGIS
jgi:hypothetical protein